MSEEKLVELLQSALAVRGIDDQVVAAGEFFPRGHIGGLFVGGMTGAEVGGTLGSLAEGAGLAAGSLAGMRAADAASGLPSRMLVAVTATMVYGFAERSRHDQPTELAFRVPRADLTAKIHQRVNVRVLELIDAASGSRIELEGSRVPLTHSKDVIEALRS